MIKPAKPEREAERLAELHRYRILDTDPEQAYDDLLTIVAGICGTPMGAVTLIDGERQWLKARQGIDVAETSRDVAFCAHAILEPDKLMQVRDSHLDARFAGNPSAQGEAGIRFYAGAPLVTSSGNALGTLCVMDTKPRELTKEQSEALTRLARQVVSLMNCAGRTRSCSIISTNATGTKTSSSAITRSSSSRTPSCPSRAAPTC